MAQPVPNTVNIAVDVDEVDPASPQGSGSGGNAAVLATPPQSSPTTPTALALAPPPTPSVSAPSAPAQGFNFQRALLYVDALVCGLCVSTQSGINGRFAGIIESSLAPSFLSFAVGTVVIFLALGARELRTHLSGPSPASIPVPTTPGTPVTSPSAPHRPFRLPYLLAGVLGATFVFTTVLVPQQIGLALFFVMAVTGQLVGSLVLDTIHFLDIPHRPLTVGRVLGVLVLVTGSVLAAVEQFVSGRSGSVGGGATAGYCVLALVCGSLLPIQAAINRRMTLVLKNVGLAVGISFLCGTLALFLAVIIEYSTRAELLDALGNLRGGFEWYMAFAGFIGIFYVGSATIFGPRLGLSIFFVCVIAGQLASSLAYDASGVWRPAVEPGTLRIIGVLVAFFGALLVNEIFPCLRGVRFPSCSCLRAWRGADSVNQARIGKDLNAGPLEHGETLKV